ncbi:MAG: 5'/3'-nucleotidase SurE [Bacteroidales bacterium]|nr:5'/3'-nucleotidase SurE [Bacteroidales bacterium]
MTPSERLILVCNDDGYFASGIASLIEVVRPLGRVIVVAPEKGESGKSHSITMTTPIRLNLIKEEKNLCIYACSGTPVDSLKLALHQVLDRKPDLVVSGINHGSNSSISVIYSGTMGAVIEACLNGIPAVGFSLLDYATHPDFTASKHVAKIIVNNILQFGLPNEVCLNVNIPKLPIKKLKGIKLCRQAKGVWKEDFVKRLDPHNTPYYWMTGNFDNFEPNATDTDEYALANGYASVVPVKIDFTAYQAYNFLEKWNYEL